MSRLASWVRAHILCWVPSVCIAWALAGGSTATAAETGSLSLPAGFTSNEAMVNGTTIHYVRGGAGPTVVLLHGFPESWRAYRELIPELARHFSVVAPDLRGIGGSQPVAGRYDAATLAQDVHELVEQLRAAPAFLVGHDVGGWAAYAFARRYPAATRGLVLVESPVPGLDPWEKLKTDPSQWHVGFFKVPGLAEKLIKDRQRVFFRAFFDGAGATSDVIGDAQVLEYAAAYDSEEHLRAAFEMYRAIPLNEKLNAAATGALATPVMLVGGEHGFATLLPPMAADARAHGWTHVSTAVVKGARHYLLDSHPLEVVRIFESFAATRRAD